MERLVLLRNQLSVKTDFDSEDTKKLISKYRAKSTVNADAIRQTIFGKNVAIRQRILDILANDPIYKQVPVNESTRKEIRLTSYRWIKNFFDKFGIVTYEDYQKNPAILSIITTYLYEFDASLSVKLGVHYNLYLKTIINLGTEKHRPFIDRGCSFDDIGCFGLTELGHGSNVRGVLTRADFDPKTREFIINTPVDIAMKFWIGAAAHLANMAVVMAQLHIGEKNYGVHGFIVPIRDKTHTLLPGVLVGDCGLKVGLNAIDNGFLIFKNVRVPYDNLLDKFSTITSENKFKSSIKSADKRFGISLGSLSGGRIQLIDCTSFSLKNALTISTRYAACRRQFGAPNETETNILEYPLTQYRLFPYLAEAFAFLIANCTISEVWASNQDKIFSENNPLLAEIHNLTSVLKPLVTWSGQKGIQEAREICGGLGYSAYNRLGQLREDNDINATWEGDNNVLLQQTSKFVIECLRSLKAGNKPPFPSLKFLQEELTPYENVSGQESHFKRDQFNVRKAFEIRANYLIHTAFEYFSKNMMESGDGWEAWNNSQVFYLRDAALAYGEVYVMHQFENAVHNCSDEATQKVLRKLFELFGYNRLEQRTSTFFEIGYFVKSDLIFIREKIKELCKELKEEVIGLIDAIAVPDSLLNSPIGSYDGDIYNRFINAVWTAPGAFERAPYWREIREGKN